MTYAFVARDFGGTRAYDVIDATTGEVLVEGPSLEELGNVFDTKVYSSFDGSVVVSKEPGYPPWVMNLPQRTLALRDNEFDHEGASNWARHQYGCDDTYHYLVESQYDPFVFYRLRRQRLDAGYGESEVFSTPPFVGRSGSAQVIAVCDPYVYFVAGSGSSGVDEVHRVSRAAGGAPVATGILGDFEAYRWERLQVSDDGSTVLVWISPTSDEMVHRLYKDFGSGFALVGEWSSVDDDVRGTTLSPDGSRVTLRTEDEFRVLNAATLAVELSLDALEFPTEGGFSPDNQLLLADTDDSDGTLVIDVASGSTLIDIADYFVVAYPRPFVLGEEPEVAPFWTNFRGAYEIIDTGTRAPQEPEPEGWRFVIEQEEADWGALGYHRSGLGELVSYEGPLVAGSPVLRVARWEPEDEGRPASICIVLRGDFRYADLDFPYTEQDFRLDSIALQAGEASYPLDVHAADISYSSETIETWLRWYTDDPTPFTGEGELTVVVVAAQPPAPVGDGVWEVEGGTYNAVENYWTVPNGSTFNVIEPGLADPDPPTYDNFIAMVMARVNEDIRPPLTATATFGTTGERAPLYLDNDNGQWNTAPIDYTYSVDGPWISFTVEVEGVDPGEPIQVQAGVGWAS